MNIEKITWFDAQTSAETFDVKEAKQHLKPQYTVSIGFLIDETDDYVTLAYNFFGSNVYKFWQIIPKPMIKKRETIKNIEEN